MALLVNTITLEPRETVVMKFLREQDEVKSSGELETGCIPMNDGARVVIYVSDVLVFYSLFYFFSKM